MRKKASPGFLCAIRERQPLSRPITERMGRKLKTVFLILWKRKSYVADDIRVFTSTEEQQDRGRLRVGAE